MNVRTAPSAPPVPGYETEALAHALHGDPFRVLGPHETAAGRVVRAFLPGAESRRGAAALAIARASDGLSMSITACFRASSATRRRICCASHGRTACRKPRIPTRSAALLGDIDLHLFSEGRHFKLAHALGANVMTIDGVRGTRFAVWAPNARRVSVVGDFNALGRTASPDAPAPSAPASGNCSSRASSSRRALQVRHRRRRRHSLPQKADPLAHAGRSAACHGFGRGERRAVSLARRRVDARARRSPRRGRAALGLRGASRRLGCAPRTTTGASSLWDDRATG